jgi:serine/threonine protein kinase
LVGAVIGSYKIVQKLGAGGMGAVYLGQHTLLGRRAAIKVLLPALSARPDIVNRFFNEARAVTSISDPGIVQVFDFGYHSDGSAFIVMEYLDGEPLDRRLARRKTLSVTEALRLCRQLASSLAAAHAQHIIHRDLKPENIFLVHDGEVASGERPKILDFGIAKLSDEHPSKFKTHTGMVMGTPMYMSPEQGRGLAGIDHRSDIYSLGCVLFHLLTGEPPFDGEGVGDIISAHIREPAPAPSSRVPEIPSSVDALVLHCLAKRPADRFQSMVELATAISSFLPQASASASMDAVRASSSSSLAKVSAAATVELEGPSETSITRAPDSGRLAKERSTTLRESKGQIETLPPPPPPRPRRIGPWVAGLVVGAAMVAIVVAIIGMQDPAGPTSGPANGAVASRPTESATPVEPSAPPASSASGVTQDASVVVESQPPRALPDGSETTEAKATDTGQEEQAQPVPPAGSVAPVAPVVPKGPPSHNAAVGSVATQKLIVQCTIEGHAESHPTIDAGANLKVNCLVRNAGSAMTGALNFNVSLAGRILGYVQTKSIGASKHAMSEVPITIPHDIPPAPAELSIIAHDGQHSTATVVKLPVVIRSP